MISIIGGGPVGSYAAWLLARAGYDVSVFEEHEKIGEPVQCTGIVTPAIERLMELKREVVANRSNKARIYAPDGKYLDVKLKENIIVDRKKFDSYIANEAEKAGARFFLNHKFIHFKRRDEEATIRVRDNKKNRVKELKTSMLIGADGPLSSVAKSVGLFGKRSFVLGLQNVIEDENNNVIEFYPVKKGIAWVVPEGDGRVRAGVAVRDNVNIIHEGFIRNRFGGEYRKKIISQQAGLIPLYNPDITTQNQNVFLVGDAATQVKATTFGGIVTGLIAARALAKSITNYESYERNWRNAIGKELMLSLKIRKILDSFSKEDYNKLIGICNNEKIKELLEKYDRDFPSRFLIKMILAEPRLLYFAKYFYRLL